MRTRVRWIIHSVACLWLGVYLFFFVAIEIFDSDAVKESLEHLAQRQLSGLRIPSLRYAGIDWIALALCSGFVFVSMGPPVLWLGYWAWRRSKAKRSLGMCSRCGYDLTGNLSGICPECGKMIEVKVAT